MCRTFSIREATRSERKLHTKCRWTKALVRNRIVIPGEDCECFFSGHLRSKRRCQLGGCVNSVQAATLLRRPQHSPQGTRGLQVDRSAMLVLPSSDSLDHRHSSVDDVQQLKGLAALAGE